MIRLSKCTPAHYLSSGDFNCDKRFWVKIFGSCRPFGVCTCGQVPSGRLSLFSTPHFRCSGRLWYFAILVYLHGYSISTLNRELGMAKLMRGISDKHPWKVWFHIALAHLIPRIHLNKGRDSIVWLSWQWGSFEGFIFAHWLTCTFLVWPGQSRTVFVTTNNAMSYGNLE